MTLGAELRAAFRLHVRGRVQGVGYRYFAARLARGMALDGWVRNLGDGSVEVEVQGSASEIEVFIAGLRRGPSHAVVAEISRQEIPASAHSGFDIDI